MKKFRKIIALTLALTLVLLSLVSCGGNENASGSVTLVVAGEETKEYEVSLDGLTIDRGLVSVLDALKSDGKLDYGITGTMLDYVGDVKNDYEKDEYIYIYTSVEKDHDVSEYKREIEYKGQKLVNAGMGADQMAIEGGALIYIGTIKW